MKCGQSLIVRTANLHSPFHATKCQPFSVSNTTFTGILRLYFLAPRVQDMSHIRDIVNGRSKAKIQLPLLSEYLKDCIILTGNLEDFATTSALRQSHQAYCKLRSHFDAQMSLMITEKRFDRQIASALLSRNRRDHNLLVTPRKLKGGARGYAGVRITRPCRCPSEVTTREQMLEYLSTPAVDRRIAFRPVQVTRDFRPAGLCAIASETILRGTIVCEYRGERISDSVATQRLDSLEEGQHAKLLWVYTKGPSANFVIDGAASDHNPASLINHSRNHANLKLVTLRGSHPDPAVLLIATRDITQGMELLFDYGERIGADFLRNSQTLRPTSSYDKP